MSFKLLLCPRKVFTFKCYKILQNNLLCSLNFKVFCSILYFFLTVQKKLQEVIEKEEAEGRPVNREETQEEKRNRLQFAQRMDIEDNDIIIQGSNATRLSRKQVKYSFKTKCIYFPSAKIL